MPKEMVKRETFVKFPSCGGIWTGCLRILLALD